MEVGEIYNDLRYLKTTLKDCDEINKEARILSNKYGFILRKYENHEPIDFDYFRTTKATYFGLNKIQITIIRLKYYKKTKFLYHLLIISPVALIIIGTILENQN